MQLTHQTAGAAPKEDKPTKCYGEGSSCTNAKQCCSGICTNRQCAAEIPTCTGPGDCTGIDDECQRRTCINGICGVAYTGSGIPVSNQVAGDCQSNVCDGSGGIMSIADDSDVPVSPSACAIGTCTGGVPSVEYLDPRTPCATGGLICDGAGQCVACLTGDTRSLLYGSCGNRGCRRFVGREPRRAGQTGADSVRASDRSSHGPKYATGWMTTAMALPTKAPVRAPFQCGLTHQGTYRCCVPTNANVLTPDHCVECCAGRCMSTFSTVCA